MATKEIGVVEDEVSDKYIGLVNWSIIEAKGVVFFLLPFRFLLHCFSLEVISSVCSSPSDNSP